MPAGRLDLYSAREHRSVDHIGKHIERRFRRLFLGSLRLMRSRAGDPAGLADLRAPAILLIRHDRIGDAIISTPAIELLRHRFPDARIDILLGRRNAAAAGILPFIDDHFILPAAASGTMATIGAVRKRKYDVAINLLAKDSASGALLTGLVAARYRIGFAGAASSAYDFPVEKPATALHIVEQTARLLQPFGIDTRRESIPALSVRIPPEARASAKLAMARITGDDRGANVIINISGSGPEKFWGEERYAGLLTLLRGRGLAPILAASPADGERLRRIAVAGGARFLPPVADLATFAAMLAHADMIVTPDTSIVHIAAALGRPTVMLAGAAETGNIWGPWHVANRVVHGDGSLAAIAIENVHSAIESLASETLLSISPSSAS
ncbi:MAG: putative ADP-heptose:LPS heptosyltransferase [Chlorobi bacterium]|nr:putative ADP-heptose:LPS heptosyltransferase [Chlorobiota bacterium]